MAIGRAGGKRYRGAGNRAHDDGQGHQADDQDRPQRAKPYHCLLEGVAGQQGFQRPGAPQQQGGGKEGGKQPNATQDAPPRGLG